MVSSRVKQKKVKSRSRRSRSRSRRRSVGVSSGLKRMPKIYNRDAKDGVRGWDKNKPKSVQERRNIMAVCGPKCFGKPQTLGFPVCDKHISKPSECGPDCKGLLAAYARARQWRKRNPGVAKRVRKSAERVGCMWTKRRSAISKKSKRHPKTS